MSLCSLVLTNEDQERQLSNIGTNPLGTLLGLEGSGLLSAGALAALAENNPALAALLGSGLNGLTGNGFAGAAASSLVSGGGNSLLGSLLSGGNGGKGGKGGKGGVSGLFSGGKGGKGKHRKH